MYLAWQMDMSSDDVYAHGGTHKATSKCIHCGGNEYLFAQ